MKKISIGIQPTLKHTQSLLSSGLLYDSSIINEIKRLGKRHALFCDEKVAAHIGKNWRNHLEKAGLNIALFSFPSGEQEKSRERKTLLEDALLMQKFGKDSCIIALGGGVTTDLVGFLASTYCRGIPLVFAPTTLLGMVDAAIGGKTSVNTAFGKNLIGTFYPADYILIDPSTLSSLPKTEWVNGLAEVIKYALIGSLELLQALRNWNPSDGSYIEMIIQKCLMIKAEVVEADFEEKQGLRRILNFGHTIGHALELVEDYQLPHGEAVALGMLVESFLSVRMGFLDSQSFFEIEKLIRFFPFSLKMSKRVTREKMLEALILDKKNKEGLVRCVLLQKIGAYHPFAGEYCAEVPQDKIEEALSWMLSLFQENSHG